MRISLVLPVILSLVLTGCPSAFQPPPDAYANWKRKGTSREIIEKNLIECGYPNLRGEGRNTPDNEVALMQLCMEKHGFKYTNRLGTFCKSYPNLPACVAAAEEKRQRR